MEAIAIALISPHFLDCRNDCMRARDFAHLSPCSTSICFASPIPDMVMAVRASVSRHMYRQDLEIPGAIIKISIAVLLEVIQQTRPDSPSTPPRATPASPHRTTRPMSSKSFYQHQEPIQLRGTIHMFSKTASKAELLPVRGAGHEPEISDDHHQVAHPRANRSRKSRSSIISSSQPDREHRVGYLIVVRAPHIRR